MICLRVPALCGLRAPRGQVHFSVHLSSSSVGPGAGVSALAWCLHIRALVAKNVNSKELRQNGGFVDRGFQRSAESPVMEGRGHRQALRITGPRLRMPLGHSFHLWSLPLSV